MTCPSCAAEVAASSRFCSSCGAPVGTPSMTPTRAALPRAPRAPDRAISSDAPDQGRFIPGTLFAGRYRVVGLLGRGGMGEVYRADDLKLGQPVALKFLPEGLGGDAGKLARFHAEVRVARQVSHPNVCRVYDIGEAEGVHFLSMELVDGENLASLLRQVGRFPRDKAVEIAHQLCAGLAAAHERGVLHRDLKPMNVMIDGRGKARIMDFGLAGFAEEFTGAEVRSGTPAYMAPEQIEGREVTVRSDVYSLGLVLYELFTGKPAYKAGGPAGALPSRQSGTITSPSSHLPDLDPAVERAIMRCLAAESRERPASALAVAASLPGGDPLAAAIAAGETPSPEMVAAAGEAGALSRGAAWALLLSALAGILAAAALAAPAKLIRRVPMEKSPEALAEKAREILGRLGHAGPAADEGWGFEEESDYLRWIGENDGSPGRWDGLRSGRPPAITFWYRRSPRLLVYRTDSTWRVGRLDPPPTASGEATVVLDTLGRLVRLEVLPPQVEEPVRSEVKADWAALFADAGLDASAFESVDPEWTPPMHADARAAWKGALPEKPETPVRVEAAAFQGRPVYFRIVGPWTRPERMLPDARSTGQRAAGDALGVLMLIALAGAVLLSRRNLRLGRGDRAGATRLAAFLVVVHVVVWVVYSEHVADVSEEWGLFIQTTGYTLYTASLIWLFYVALEPYVRRRWPDTMIAWSRLLAGRFRDSLVGRDLLVGAASGAAVAVVAMVGALPAGIFGRASARPASTTLFDLVGLRMSAGHTLDLIAHSIFDTMVPLFFLFLLRLILRKPWLAIPTFWLIPVTLTTLQADDKIANAAVVGVAAAVFIGLLTRFGFLAAAAMQFVVSVAAGFPAALSAPSWQIGATALPLLACAALAAYGFRTALGGRPALGGGLMEE